MILQKIVYKIYFLLFAIQITFGQSTNVTCPNGASVTATANSYTESGTQCTVNITLSSTIYNSDQRTNYVGLGDPSWTSNLFNGNYGTVFPSTTSITGNIILNASCTAVQSGSGAILIQQGSIGGPSCGTLALPVELSSFTGKPINNSIALNWETASEKNNDYFAVDRSKDGINFDELHQVKGFGNSSETQFYSWADTKPLAGINYYRLRQVDYDGKIVKHEIIAVKFDDINHSRGISVYPAVVKDRVTIKMDIPTTEQETLYVMDLSGRILHSEPIALGTTQRDVQLSKLQSGQYVIKLQSDRTLKTVRFIKL